MNKTVAIMAAGMGSRYGGLKQLDKVGPSGETIIDYSVYDAAKAGFNKVVFIIREDFDDLFRKQISNKFASKIKVEYVYQQLENIPKGFSIPPERIKPWGTGHAMLSAREAIKEPFIIINADDFYGYDAFKKSAIFLDSINPETMNAALCGFYLKNTLSENGTVSRGLCKVESGSLIDIEESHGIYRDKKGIINSEKLTNINSETITSMNIWAFSPLIFNYAEKYFKDFLLEHGNELKSEFYIPVVINNLIKKEFLKITVIETDSEWYGVTYKEDKPGIVKTISAKTKKQEYPFNLWK